MLQGRTELVTIFKLCTGFTGEVQTRTVVTIHGATAEVPCLSFAKLVLKRIRDLLEKATDQNLLSTENHLTSSGDALSAIDFKRVSDRRLILWHGDVHENSHWLQCAGVP